MGIVNKQASPAATTPNNIHTVTAGQKLIYNINACNKGATTAKIRLSETIGAVTTYIEYDLPLVAAGTGVGNTIERTARKLPAGAVVTVYSDSANVDWTLDGVEEAA